MLSVLVFRLFPDLSFAVLPAFVLCCLGLFKIFENRLPTQNLSLEANQLIEIPAWRILAFLMFGIFCPLLSFLFTGLGPLVWLPLILISYQFLVPGQWTRFLLAGALLALIWVCALLRFQETTALVICCFSIAMIVMGESERRNVA